MPEKWKIICKPEGKYPLRTSEDEVDESRSAMIVLLTDGHQQQEVSRVGFVRENTTHPSVPFEEQLRVEIEKARTSTRILNDMLADSGGDTV